MIFCFFFFYFFSFFGFALINPEDLAFLAMGLHMRSYRFGEWCQWGKFREDYEFEENINLIYHRSDFLGEKSKSYKIMAHTPIIRFFGIFDFDFI